MKKLFFLLFLMCSANFVQATILEVQNDETTLHADKKSTKKDSLTVIKPHSKETYEKEKSLQKQAEEIPVVFGQWWFWMGLGIAILFLKFVIFKK